MAFLITTKLFYMPAGKSRVKQFPSPFLFTSHATDRRDNVHLAVVAADHQTWYLSKNPQTGKWTVLSLDGKAREMQLYLKSDLSIVLFAIGMDNRIYRKSLRPKAGSWTNWVLIGPERFESLVISLPVAAGRLVVCRKKDGSLWFNRLDKEDAFVDSWQDLGSPGKNISLHRLHSGTLVGLLTSPDNKLLALAWDPSSHTFAKPVSPLSKLSGGYTATVLSSGKLAVVGEAGDGQLVKTIFDEKKWTKPAVITEPRMKRYLPTIAEINGSVLLTALDADRNICYKLNNQNWKDTGTPYAGPQLLLQYGAFAEFMGPRHIGSLITSISHFIPFVLLEIDQVLPASSFEGDAFFQANFSIWNHTPTTTDGFISGVLATGPTTGRVLHLPVTGLNFPPVAPSQTVTGTAGLATGAILPAGDFFINISYGKWTFAPHYVIIVSPVTGIPQVSLALGGEYEFYASDSKAIKIWSYGETFPTDIPDSAGGAATCATQPFVVDEANYSVISYNDQVLCNTVQTVYGKNNAAWHTIQLLNTVTSIAQVQNIVRNTAAAGRRLRVIGNEHTANNQLCTDGDVIFTHQLQGAVPYILFIRDEHSPSSAIADLIDASADLNPPSPINAVADRDWNAPRIETFEGSTVVRVGPGMKLDDLYEWLEQKGWSLGFAIPGFRGPREPDQAVGGATVAGAISTGTHGSSAKNKVVISNRVLWMLMVMADGSLREFSATLSDDSTWKAVKTSLGYLGVVVQVRLVVEPTFNLKASVRWHSIKDLLGDDGPMALIGNNDFCEIVWYPRAGSDDAPIMVLTGDKTNEPAEAGMENRILRPYIPINTDALASAAFEGMEKSVCSGDGLKDWETINSDLLRYLYPPLENRDGLGVHNVAQVIYDVADSDIVNEFLQGYPSILSYLADGLLDLAKAVLWPLTWQSSSTETDGVATWYKILSSSIHKKTNRPWQRDWELFIPAQNAKAALQFAKNYFKANDIYLPLIGVFLRFAPAESGTLLAHTVAGIGGVQEGQPGMFFEMPAFLPKKMTCSNKAIFENPFLELAKALIEQFGARAHWAKNTAELFQFQRQQNVYQQNLVAFRQVVNALDPKGLFANQFGIDMGLRWIESGPIPANTAADVCLPG